MLFADDIMVSGSQKRVNGKLKVWREALEGNGFRITRGKT